MSDNEKPSVDLSGLTRYEFSRFNDNQRQTYFLTSDVQALATKAAQPAPAPQPTTSAPRVASIDTPEFRKLLRDCTDVENPDVGYGDVARFIDAHIARQAQAAPTLASAPQAERAVVPTYENTQVAYAEDGVLHWMTGRKFDNCELYAAPVAQEGEQSAKSAPAPYDHAWENAKEMAARRVEADCIGFAKDDAQLTKIARDIRAMRCPDALATQSSTDASAHAAPIGHVVVWNKGGSGEHNSIEPIGKLGYSLAAQLPEGALIWTTPPSAQAAPAEMRDAVIEECAAMWDADGKETWISRSIRAKKCTPADDSQKGGGDA